MSEHARSENQLHHFFPTAWVSSRIFSIIFSTSGCGSGDGGGYPSEIDKSYGPIKRTSDECIYINDMEIYIEDSHTDTLDVCYFLYFFDCFLGFNLYYDDNIIISYCQIFLYCYSPSSVSEGTSKPPPTSRRKLGVCDYLSSLFSIANL